MRQLTKFDIILHKVGINTRAYLYYSKPRAEKAIRQIQYNKSAWK